VLLLDLSIGTNLKGTARSKGAATQSRELRVMEEGRRFSAISGVKRGAYTATSGSGDEAHSEEESFTKTNDQDSKSVNKNKRGRGRGSRGGGKRGAQTAIPSDDEANTSIEVVGATKKKGRPSSKNVHFEESEHLNELPEDTQIETTENQTKNNNMITNSNSNNLNTNTNSNNNNNNNNNNLNNNNTNTNANANHNNNNNSNNNNTGSNTNNDQHDFSTNDLIRALNTAETLKVLFHTQSTADRQRMHDASVDANAKAHSARVTGRSNLF